jgi:hypothetical protein
MLPASGEANNLWFDPSDAVPKNIRARLCKLQNLIPHLVPPAIMVWIFVWKYMFEPFIHILQHFVLQLSRSTDFCF